jgi:alkylation response protein AidB-like acyl-CoA dehydrogenase
VRFAFTSEQDALREQARAFLSAESSATWQELAELGWTGVSVRPELGGSGLGFVEEGILFEEAGRALLHAPLYSTVALVLPVLDDALQAEVARGDASWTLARGRLVPDLDSAGRVAIVEADGIYELEGCNRELLETVDVTRPLGVISGGERGRRLGDGSLLPEIRRRSLVALALESCGVGRRALEYAVEHASTREQFGRPIGVYQAVSHALATSYAELELARSTALWAAWCIAARDPQAEIAALTAKALSTDAAVTACERSIQVHGGIGFTWEHVLHRLYKRALGAQAWEASAAEVRSEVAAHLLDRPVLDTGA